MVKILRKSSSVEPAGPISTKLGILHPGVQPIIVCSNDDPGVTLTYFTARSNLATSVLLWQKVETVDFSETIAVSDMKVGRCRQLIEFMKLCEYRRSRSFLYHIFFRFCMFCALFRPRYQVSVYRTIGPLVFCFVAGIFDLSA